MISRCRSTFSFVVFAVMAVSLSFGLSGTAYAGYGCLQKVHASALNDAILLMPSELQDILQQHQDEIINEVRLTDYSYDVNYSEHTARSRNSGDVRKKDFVNNCENAIWKIKAGDSSKNSEFVVMMADASRYIFMKYYPFRTINQTTDLCDTGLLKKSFVLFNGNDNHLIKNYNSYSVREAIHYSDDESKTRWLAFYNALVNETANLWLSIWSNSGKDITPSLNGYFLVDTANAKIVKTFPYSDKTMSADKAINTTGAKPDAANYHEVESYGAEANEKGLYYQAFAVFDTLGKDNPSDKSILYNLSKSQYGLHEYKSSFEKFAKLDYYRDSLYYVLTYKGESMKKAATPNEKANLFADVEDSYDRAINLAKDMSVEEVLKIKELMAVLSTDVLSEYKNSVNAAIFKAEDNLSAKNADGSLLPEAKKLCVQYEMLSERLSNKYGLAGHHENCSSFIRSIEKKQKDLTDNTRKTKSANERQETELMKPH